MSSNLFQMGKFQLHSGQESDFKINCDALTWRDWRTLAHLTNKMLPQAFGSIVQIERGGWYFGNAMSQYIVKGMKNVLIVDDVFTTGASMEEARNKVLEEGFPFIRDVFGAVVFARNPVPSWILALFQMGGKLDA